ncbi:MAG: hypothetical protein IPI49_29420 [Myxococcales bacterium]|nr:hypothetical protein [Myxococcales bacterium]
MARAAPRTRWRTWRAAAPAPPAPGLRRAPRSTPRSCEARPYIKVAAGNAVKDSKVTIIDGKVVTILADPGAKLDRDGDGQILEIRSPTTDVKIYDLEITGASGATDADAIILTPNGGTPS